MPRPRHTLEFGSDSFLDVLANIVGILIILIVIASTRLARIPAPPAAAVTMPAEAAEVEAPVEIPEPIVIVQKKSEDLGDDVAPPDIAAQLAAIDQQLEEMKSREQASGMRLSAARELAAAKKSALDSRETLLRQQAEALKADRSKLASLKTGVGQAREQLKGVLAEFEAAGQAKSKVTTLKHTVTPISQLIEGPELHFRLSENRVSVIPLEELVTRVKSQLERQKEYLARHRRTEGSVGPVRGFSLHYVVETRSLSPLEEVRHGQGLFRINLTGYEIVPEPELDTETAEQALRRGSKFARAIEDAEENTSLTFWVYPDSFGLFRKLQAEAQKAGFVVAGRPLPEGAPIAGSPTGTRSVGQ